MQVMEDHLEGKQWLAAGQYTIADIANFSWVLAAPYAGTLPPLLLISTTSLFHVLIIHCQPSWINS